MKVKISFFKFSLVMLSFLFLALLSGFRNGGADYEQYLEMIRIISTADGFLGHMLLAKDVMFGFIVYVCKIASNGDYVKVFVVIAFLAFLLKFIYLQSVKSLLLFFVVYLVLFAPSLDFAAIRAMLAVSFLLAFIYLITNSRHFVFTYILGVFAVLSHVSMLLPVLLSVPLFQKLARKHLVFSSFALLTISLSAKVLLSQFRGVGGYIDAAGTLYAYIPVFLNLAAVLILLVAFKKRFVYEKFTLHCLYTSLFITIMCIGFTSISAVISGRFLQVAQLLLLVVFSNVKIIRNKYYLLTLILCFFVFLFPLFFRNLNLGLWELALGSIVK